MDEPQITRVSSGSEIAIPLHNLISIIAGVAVATWAYFALQERVNNVEHNLEMMQMDMRLNSEFRIKWPRGELGSLPADARQDLLLENIEKRLEAIDVMRHELNEYRVQIELLRERETRSAQ